MVASKCFRNHFMSKKYKTVLHFLQNSRLMPLYTSDSDCKDVGNIPGRHFVTAFSALRSHSLWCQLHYISAGTSTLISVEGTGKNQLEQVRRVRGCPIVVIVFFAKKSLTKTDRCVGALSWRRNQMLVSHFSGRFLLTASQRRRRMSKYISLFTVAIPVNYTSEFRELLEATVHYHCELPYTFLF
jgi:hypothetical protein